MLLSTYDNEILTYSLELICPYCILSVNFSHVSIIYAEIFKKSVEWRFRSFVQYSLMSIFIYEPRCEKTGLRGF